MNDFTAFWRAPEHTPLKLAVIIGLLLHASFFISIETGWWDSWFINSAPLFRTASDGTLQFDRQRGTDFFAIYLAAHQLVRGQSIYPIEHLPEYREITGKLSDEWKERLEIDEGPSPDYSDVVPYFDPFRYLPVASYIGIPLILLGPTAAYWAWILFYEVLFFASILWIGHRFGSMRGLHIAAAMYLFFTPWYPEIYMGQYSFLQSVFILGLLLGAGGNNLRAGGWWAASVLWKLNTGICLPAIIRWHLWRPIIWLIVLIIVTCGPYFAVHPVDGLKFILINFRPPGPASPGNFGFLGVISKLFYCHADGGDTPARPVAQYIAMAFFVIIGIAATVRAPKSRFAECICLWLTTYFLVYIDVWEHQYVMLLPAVVFLYLRRPGIIPWLIWLIFACPTTYKYFYDVLHASVVAGLPVDLMKDTSFFNDWHFSLIKPLGLLAMYIYCVWLTAGGGKDSGGQE